MGCACKEIRAGVLHRHSQTLPAEPCAFCGEKHICTAAAMAREMGYEGVNRQFIIGEMSNAELHLWRLSAEGREVAERIRRERLRVQSREAAAEEIDWNGLLDAVGKLADDAAQNDLKV